MEAIVLCGLQGAGKTTLYRDRWLETHVRISMDLLRTRAREAALLELCLGTRQPFVVDNTNPTVADRARYVEPARAAGFRVVGYLVDASARARRWRATPAAAGARGCPTGRARARRKRLIRPAPEEGFDELWHAVPAPGGGWRIEPLREHRAALLSSRAAP